MKKNEVFNLILIIAIVLAFSFLIVAMGAHAAEGNDSILSVVFAAVSAFIGIISLVLILIKLRNKGKKDKDEEQRNFKI